MTTKKNAFRTPIDEPITISTTSGEKEEEVLAMRLNDKGEEEFYIQGKTNVYEKTQAFKEECLIENILRKVTDTGDTNLLMQRTGSYIDISEMPNNIFEAHQQIEEARKIFENLPLETRAKYDHSFDKYLADFGTKEWFKNMGIDNAPKEEPKTKEEVKGDNKE